jgi:hypothetical protein
MKYLGNNTLPDKLKCIKVKGSAPRVGKQGTIHKSKHQQLQPNKNIFFG